MHEFVSLNCRIIRSSDSFLAATSAAALYAKGVFTTVAIYNSKPFQWERHWQRLTGNARKIGVDLTGISKERLEQSLLEIIAANCFTTGRARLTIFDESSSRIWQNEQASKTTFLIQTADFRLLPTVFRLTVSPFTINSKSPLAGIKSCNYLENILALDDARTKGFDEAVRLNESGEIVSAIMANIFWIKNGEIFSPDSKTGCLKGTTRAVFLENFAVREVQEQTEALADADAVFLTSAGIGVACVDSFENRKFTADSDIFKKLQNFFLNLCRNS